MAAGDGVVTVRWRRREIRAPPTGETPACQPVDPDCASISGRFPAQGSWEESFSSVTGGTILQRLNFPVVDEFLPVRPLRVGVSALPVQVSDFVQRTQLAGGVAMAVQTKGHAQRLGMVNFVHLIDLAVAFDATDAAVDMDGMVEINVIGQLVNLHPGMGLPVAALSRTRASRASSLRPDCGSSCRPTGRDVGIPGFLDAIMAVAAIHAQLVGMNAVGKGHRLNRLVADPRIFGREIISDPGGHGGADQRAPIMILRGRRLVHFGKISDISAYFSLHQDNNKTPAMFLPEQIQSIIIFRTAATRDRGGNSPTAEKGHDLLFVTAVV